jgi:hypothetical protein
MVTWFSTKRATFMAPPEAVVPQDVAETDAGLFSS